MPSCTISGLTFDYDDDGPASGDPVLLLHGFPQDRTSWGEVAAGLQDAGFRTITVDQRGYSPRARPTRTRDYTLAHLTSDATGLLDSLGIDQAHVIGHDWGGAVAWALASGAEDRLLSLSVLSTPHPGAMSQAALRSTQLAKSWYMGLFQVPYAAEVALSPGGPLWQGVMRGLPADSVAHYTDRARQPGALTAMLRWYRALPLDIARPSVPSHRVRLPTLYVWGRRDPALGEAAALATAKFVTGPYTFVALPDHGHWLPEQAAPELLPILTEHLMAWS